MKHRPAARWQHAILAAALTACSSSAPQEDGEPPDSAAAATPAAQDRYFEGSRQVWEDARARGVVLRAVGQEPGWVLEIDTSRITFATNYGADEVITPGPQPVTDPAAASTTYHAVTEAHDLHISVREMPCSDTMSEEQFSLTVEVVLDGTTYRGCGRWLDRLPL